MATELEKLLGEESKPIPPEEKKEPAKEPELSEEDLKIKAKAEQLANLNKAIADEQERLRSLRKDIKAAKGEEEELPLIDLKDPAAKAWDKRINDASAPAQKELEKAKEERRLFALKKFLGDKPALAKNPEKIKSMMETYDRLKTSTELTSEGIEMDLEKAYAAEHAEELISAARQSRVETARNDAVFSDIAVSRGSTAYSTEKPKVRAYTEEEKTILAKWNMTPEEHAKMMEEQKQKEA